MASNTLLSDANIVGSPVYFFYDCETTGLDTKEDRIIELAAVLDTLHLPPGAPHPLGKDDSFTSLCYCTKELSSNSAEMVGLTLADLRYEPKLSDVLEAFFTWIERKVSEVERKSRTKCTPVLAAHSGTRLDFPVLFAELERINRSPLDKSSSQIVRKFHSLNLNFVDTFFVCKKLEGNPIFKRCESLSVKAIYNHFFPCNPYGDHRALSDAKALNKVFTESPLSSKFDVLREMVKSTDVAYRKWKQFEMKRAGIHRKKAEVLVRQRIYLQDMEKEYKKSPRTFKHFLRQTVDIKYPSDELMEYFSNLTITD